MQPPDPTADLHKDCVPKTECLRKRHGCGFNECDYISYFKWCIKRHMTETLKHSADVAQLGVLEPISLPPPYPSSSSSRPPPPPPATAQSRTISAADFDSSQQQQPYDIRLVSGFKVWVCGSSGVGKSVWVLNLIKHLSTVCVEPPTKVLFVYNKKQPIYEEVNGLVDVFVENQAGLAQIVQDQIDDWVVRGEKILLIADDMLLTRDTAFLDLIAASFTVGRHSGVSIVFVTQKCFPNSDQMRLAHQNANYVVYFNNPHDRGEFGRKAQKAFLTQKHNAMAIFDRVMSTNQYGHLMISFLSNPRKITFLSELFDNPHIVKAYIMTGQHSAATTFPRQALFREMYLVDEVLLQTEASNPPPPPPPTQPSDTAAAYDDDDDVPLVGAAKRKREINESDEEVPPAKKRMHTCQLCGDSFNSSTALASHILSVHNVKTTTSKHNHLIREQRKRAKRLLLQNLPPSTLKRPGKKRVKLSVVDDVGLKRLKDLPVPSLSRSAYGGHEARHSQAYPNDKKLNQLLRDK